MPPALRLLLVGAAWLAAALPAQDGAAPAAERIDFVRDVRPILRERCYDCHGPEEQEADLRFDRRAVVFDAGGDPIVVPGDPEASIIIERISLPADDPDIMPAEGEPLTEAQVATIRRWIEQGAEWPAEAAIDEQPPAPPKDELVLPEPTAEQQAAQDQALAKLRERGAHASRIAANTSACEVSFAHVREPATDDDLAALAGLEPVLVWLDLRGSAVDDLAPLAAFHELRRLDVSRTAIDSADVAALQELPHLVYLNLYGTRVDAAAIETLAAMPALHKVFLWQTGIDAEAAKRLAAKRPRLLIDLGGYAEQLTEHAEANAPANDVCPLTGKPVDPTQTLEVGGRVIGFCCNKCRGKAAADPSLVEKAAK